MVGGFIVVGGFNCVMGLLVGYETYIMAGGSYCVRGHLLWYSFLFGGLLLWYAFLLREYFLLWRGLLLWYGWKRQRALENNQQHHSAQYDDLI